MVDREEKLSTGRFVVVQYVIVAIFLGLIYQLWQLQVLQQSKYEVLAEHNRIRTEPIPAPRGRILDREGRVIVDNYPSFSAFVIRDQAHDLASDLPQIARGLHLDMELINEQLERFHDAPGYEPIVVKQDITPQDLAFIDSHRDQFPELETMMVSRRLYPKNGYLGHVIGYVGEAGDREVDQLHVRPGAVVGKFGLEQYYNDILSGVDGERRVAVDSRGREVQQYSDTPPRPGRDLRLTIDNDIQIAAEQALGLRPGAVVALNPQTGEVLAMVSRPAFDPNQFTLGIRASDWNRLLNDPDHPLMNKAIQEQEAPGSTFKIVEAAAGLEEGIAQSKKVFCNGIFDYYGRIHHCWALTEEHRTHGVVDLNKAIYQSCDIFFYSLGVDLGIEKIDSYAQAMGLGRKSGIDLPGEKSGLVPSPEWKQRRFHQPWYKGEVVSVAIGQGAMLATPLQLAHTIGGISDDGLFKRPHLVFYDEANPKSYPHGAYPEEYRFPLKPSTLSALAAGMRRVVDDGGTDSSAHLEGIDWGGKTGSAQIVSTEAFNRLGKKHQFVDNAWFVGVYPVQNARIAVCVLYEHGGHGQFAGRVAAAVIDAYYSKYVARQPMQQIASGASGKALLAAQNGAGQ
jgi:penicillin-binding protein 2